eukprot:Lankesteria_metandrocarpae@DN3851_c0_g1_i2.p1
MSSNLNVDLQPTLTNFSTFKGLFASTSSEQQPSQPQRNDSGETPTLLQNNDNSRRQQQNYFIESATVAASTTAVAPIESSSPHSVEEPLIDGEYSSFQQMVKVKFITRKGKELGILDLPANAAIEDVKELFNQKFHYYSERQWFNVNAASGPVFKEGTLEANDITDGTVLVFKDLGIQISWRLVFVIEYLGPIIIFPLLYLLPNVFYPGPLVPFKRPLAQQVGFWLAIIHYVKRELETLFVHRFSSATMPVERLPINCFHYWILFGVSVGYFVLHPKFQAPFHSAVIIYLMAAIFLVFEWLNFQTHLQLRNIRPRGTKTRGIPSGWGFDVVSCANYLWESCAWLTFAALTNTLTGWFFFVVAVGQMTIWALKKHRNYRKEFKDYPRSRRAIVPMIL